MSDWIPELRCGDRVRVMQTVDMERRSLANRRGSIQFLLDDGYNAVVLIDSPGNEEYIPINSLMRD